MFYLTYWMRTMVKSIKEQKKLDEIKILSEVMKSSKQNIDTIAKHCGFSRQKAWRLIKDLETNQNIWGYSAVVDTEKQNLEKFILFIKRTLKPHDTQYVNEITKNLLASVKKDLGITMISSYRIHGEYDWVMIFSAKDIIHAKKFTEAIMQKSPGAQSIHISQILFTVRENYIQNPNLQKMKELI